MSDKYPGGFITDGAPAGYSVAFDGTGDYLGLPLSSAFSFAGDFTLEFYLYPLTTSSSSPSYILQSLPGSLFFAVNVVAGTGFDIFLNTGSAAISVRDRIPAQYTWCHVALVRSGSTVKLYMNGIASTTTATNSSTLGSSTATFYIGNGNVPACYMSNVRVVNGTALYTSTFTPPTQLFPVANTSLLTCQSPTIIDNSSNAFAITAYGDAKVSTFTPFAAYTGFNPALGAAAGGVWTIDQAEYYQNNRLWPIYDPYFNRTTLMLHGNGTNAAQNNTFLDSSTNNFTITRNGNTTQGTFTPFSQTGWSSYFPATTDYISLPLNSCIVAANDFSLEMWVYTTSYADKAYFNSQSDSTTTGGSSWGLSINGSGNLYSNWYVGGGTVTLTSSVAMPLNTWVHIALVRTSGTFSIFQNGVIVATRSDQGTNSINNGATNYNPYINRNGSGSNGVVGYISNFRLIIGSGGYNATQNFTPSTAPLTATTNTRILACQSNRYVDNSANNYTLTPANNTAIQAFSPFVPTTSTPITYSNWFDGTGDYLSMSSGTSLGAGNFTIECWVYLTAAAASETTVGSSANYYTVGYNGNFVFRVGTSNLWRSFDGQGSQATIDGSFTWSTGQWYHMAWVRNSGTVTVYRNGTSLGSVADSKTLSDSTNGYGIAATRQASSYSSLLTGCISNLRVVVGTALYTASFTPPTAPLTNISGTSLLTCQSSTFIDNSSNALTITSAGNVQPVASPNPFGFNTDQSTLNTAYSATTNGGSGYFDGSGDYLSFSGPTIGTGAFCLEAWVYCTSTFSNQTIFGADGTNNRISIKINNSTTISVDQYGVSASNFTVATMALNAWNHIAVSRNGSSVATVFVNGVRSSTGTATLSNNYTTFNALGRFDSSSGYYLTGYIVGARATVGSTPYDPTQVGFVPPAAPPTAITNTQFLANFTNGGIIDSTGKCVGETVGTAQISTTQSKYGGSSIKTDGSTSSWVVIPFNRGLDISTGAPDWTLECWAYIVSFSNSPYLFNKGGLAAAYYTNYSFVIPSSGVAYMALGNNGGETGYNFGTVAINTWYHFAATRQGNTIRTFLNGTLVTSTTIGTTMTDNGQDLYIGCLKNLTSNVLNGYVDDFRITKGYARYTTNFTPPTSQLQDQ